MAFVEWSVTYVDRWITVIWERGKISCCRGEKVEKVWSNVLV